MTSSVHSDTAFLRNETEDGMYLSIVGGPHSKSLCICLCVVLRTGKKMRSWMRRWRRTRNKTTRTTGIRREQNPKQMERKTWSTRTRAKKSERGETSHTKNMDLRELYKLSFYFHPYDFIIRTKSWFLRNQGLNVKCRQLRLPWLRFSPLPTIRGSETSLRAEKQIFQNDTDVSSPASPLFVSVCVQPL